MDITQHMECKSRLLDLLSIIEKNNLMKELNESDAKRFVVNNCRWIINDNPLNTVLCLEKKGLSDGPIGKIMEFAYPRVDETLKGIIRMVGNNYHDSSDFAMTNFEPDHPCFNSSEYSLGTDDQYLAICMYLNEKVHIPLYESNLRGNILITGIRSLRNLTSDDCCRYESVSDMVSSRVPGDAYARYLVLENIYTEMKHAEGSVGSENIYIPITFLELSMNCQAVRNVPPFDDGGIVFDGWDYVRENYSSMSEFNCALTDMKMEFVESEKKRESQLRASIRHYLMMGIYNSNRYPDYVKHRCEVCARTTSKSCPCNMARYCSVKCQSVAYSKHRKVCTFSQKK